MAWRMPKKTVFVVASDHTDSQNRRAHEVVEFLKAQGYRAEIHDEECGPEDDFPLIARGAVEQICRDGHEGKYDKAILIGGTGSGMAMAANKFPGIRAAVVRDYKEMRGIALRDDPNIVCLKAWGFDEGEIEHLLREWFNTQPSNDPKYVRRREELKEIESRKFPA